MYRVSILSNSNANLIIVRTEKTLRNVSLGILSEVYIGTASNHREAVVFCTRRLTQRTAKH